MELSGGYCLCVPIVAVYVETIMTVASAIVQNLHYLQRPLCNKGYCVVGRGLFLIETRLIVRIITQLRQGVNIYILHASYTRIFQPTQYQSLPTCNFILSLLTKVAATFKIGKIGLL